MSNIPIMHLFPCYSTTRKFSISVPVYKINSFHHQLLRPLYFCNTYALIFWLVNRISTHKFSWSSNEYLLNPTECFLSNGTSAVKKTDKNCSRSLHFSAIFPFKLYTKYLPLFKSKYSDINSKSEVLAVSPSNCVLPFS